MTSTNHQYIRFEDKIVARYTKTIPGMLTGRRLDPNRLENEVDWLLQTPDRLFNVYVDQDTRKTVVERTGFSYEDEVIELYSPQEVQMFKRLNQSSIASGILIEYKDSAPEVDLSNVLNDDEVLEVASIKQIPALRKRISSITSIHSLKRIQDKVTELDRPISIAKVIQERMDELNRNN